MERKNHKKRKKHPELYLLFEMFDPKEIRKRFPKYPYTTVRKYYKEWEEAKKKVKEMVKK